MATAPEVQNSDLPRRPHFSAIRWSAIFAGVVAGTASYLLLALLGVAVVLMAIDPSSSKSIGHVPLATGIWTGVSMLVGAFIGGHVAGYMSGLKRSMDGMLHGFVAWGVSSLLCAVLATTAVGAVLSGAFRNLHADMPTAATTATRGDEQNILGQLAGMIASDRGRVSAQTLSSVERAITLGDHDGAVTILVNDMVRRDRAEQIVDRIGTLLQPQTARETARDIATQATDILTTTSWWLFIGLLLSLVLGIAGGASGARAGSNRILSDHLEERNAI